MFSRRMFPTQYQMVFIDRWHSITIQRFQLQQRFQSSLTQKQFMGVKAFTMQTETEFVQYIIDYVENARLFLTQYESSGSRVSLRQGPESTIVSISPLIDVWELQFPNVKMLKPILGEDYWWAASGEQFGFGTNLKRVHNFIKPIDSEIILKFDTISKKLSVSYRCVHGDHDEATEDINHSLRREQIRLLDKFYTYDKKTYRIIDVEMNATHFVQP